MSLEFEISPFSMQKIKKYNLTVPLRQYQNVWDVSRSSGDPPSRSSGDPPSHLGVIIQCTYEKVCIAPKHTFILFPNSHISLWPTWPKIFWKSNYESSSCLSFGLSSVCRLVWELHFRPIIGRALVFFFLWEWLTLWNAWLQTWTNMTLPDLTLHDSS